MNAILGEEGEGSITSLYIFPDVILCCFVSLTSRNLNISFAKN